MFIEIGSHIINLDAVSSVHWEGDILVAHLSGGRWLKLDAMDGNTLWEALASHARRTSGERLNEVADFRGEAACPAVKTA